jgi:hypothetical protein
MGDGGLISVTSFCGINFRIINSRCAGALSCNKNLFDQSNSLQQLFDHLLIKLGIYGFSFHNKFLLNDPS